MAKSNNRWDVTYETVDEQAHKIIEHVAAENVDWKTALMVKRNHKRICAMAIRPTKRVPDAGDSAASQTLSPQSGESTPEVNPAATQRR